MKQTIIIFALAVASLTTSTMSAQQLAFPGAQGLGRFA